MIRLTLPIPPSVNSYWRSTVNRRSGLAKVLISQEGRRFKTRCQMLAQMQCSEPINVKVAVTATVYFGDRRRDLDNVMKPLFDALEGVVYRNDRQIHEIHFRKALDRQNPRIEMEIEPC